MTKTPVTIRISPEIKKALQMKVLENDTSVQAVLEKAVMDYLEDKRTREA